MKLENKVAVITGGFKGIGRGIVNVFLKYGAKVVVLDYDEAVLEMNSVNTLAYKFEIALAICIGKSFGASASSLSPKLNF